MAQSRIGVCSWSLQPTSATDLVEKIQATGVLAVQLALDPIRRADWDFPALVDLLEQAEITALSGMMGMGGENYSTLDTIRETGGVRVDATWEANLAAAGENADLAVRLGLDLVTFHAGFIPHEAGPARTLMIDRLRAVVDCFADRGVRVGFETGQETAETLLDALIELDRSNLGINFDPANMILYGMGDPVAALRSLADQVMQIHIKDALPTTKEGTWGSEQPAGEGAVDWAGFFTVIHKSELNVDLLIEREAGENRLSDIQRAVKLVQDFRI